MIEFIFFAVGLAVVGYLYRDKIKSWLDRSTST